MLDETGGVRWATQASQSLGFGLHVVRDLEPRQALVMVGGKFVRELDPGELPARPDGNWLNVLHQATGTTDEGALILAGQGTSGWSFAFDLSGLTAMDDEFDLPGMPGSTFRAKIVAQLPPGPLTRALFSCSVNGDEHLMFSDGSEDSMFRLAWTDTLPPEEFPPPLRPAAEAAGVHPDENDFDTYQGLRTICALAGLAWTPEEFRNQRLAMGYF
ncbi:hypothetical protein GCM10027456_65670 [Kineosporia babensis]